MKKTSITSVLALACLAVFSACGSKEAKTEEQPAEVAAISVDDVLAKADSLVGDTIVIEGVCTHLCSHGAMKAFVAGSSDKVMLRCEANPHMGQAFPLEMTRKPVQVTGILVEQRVDSAAVAEMEKQYNAAKEQAAAKGQATSDESGCSTERTAQGQGDLTTFDERKADYLQKIAARNEAEGKPYLSFYYLEAISYEVQPE